MRKSRSTRLLCTGAVIMAGMVGMAAPSAAETSPPDQRFDFAAGQACDFPLTVEVYGVPPITKEFRDRQGNLVRTLVAGKGTMLTFFDFQFPAETYTLKANGAVTRTVPNADGTSTVTTGGHNVIFLFPTDSPAGPSTTLYTGQVVFLVDAAFNYTLLKTSGKATDICAQLS